VARIGFDIPFHGSHIVFAIGTLIFLTTYLAQGLVISVIARNQQVAMQLSMMMGLLPTNLLSGFIFPVESMPEFFRYFTMILPARWFMKIARDSFLVGSNIIDLKIPFIALILIAIVMVLLAAKKFKKDLEP
jgi:ABC-2 type transport system permease protein